MKFQEIWRLLSSLWPISPYFLHLDTRIWQIEHYRKIFNRFCIDLTLFYRKIWFFLTKIAHFLDKNQYLPQNATKNYFFDFCWIPFSCSPQNKWIWYIKHLSTTNGLDFMAVQSRRSKIGLYLNSSHSGIIWFGQVNCDQFAWAWAYYTSFIPRIDFKSFYFNITTFGGPKSCQYGNELKNRDFSRILSLFFN